MIIIYGIKNCDSCKKAVKFFGTRAEFNDIRLSPIADEMLERFIITFGNSLINKRSKTWKTLTPVQKELNTSDLLKKFPTVMKRPIIECSETLKMSIGWNSDIQNQYG